MKSLLASKWLLSGLSALLLCLSWWQCGHPVFIFIALIPLLQLIEQYEIACQQKKTTYIFVHIFFIFLFWNIGVTWWIWNSTEVGALMAFIINALLMTMLIVITIFVGKRTKMRASWYWLFPIFWLAFEFFHQNWALSWPWLQFGNVFATTPQWIQWYEYTGTLGGSLWVWMVNLMLFFLLKRFMHKRAFGLMLAKTVMLVALPVVLSYYIYYSYQEGDRAIEVVLAQPNMDPWSEQFDSEEGAVVQRIAQSAYPLITSNTCLLVGPESALPHTFKLPHSQPIDRYVPYSSAFYAMRHSLDSLAHLKVLMGASTYTHLEAATPTSRYINQSTLIDQYNTALLLDNEGVQQFYHKTKLVPGTEFIPFAALMAPLQNLFFDLGGTTVSLGHSPQPEVFEVNDSVSVAPLICYESIYGDYASAFVRQGANLLCVITNDGWWGDTPGYLQHLNIGRLRCIELRRNMARAANTGVSAFVNARGDIMSQTAFWEQTAIKADLRIETKLTLYAKYGDYLGRTSAFVAVLSALLALGRYVKERKL